MCKMQVVAVAAGGGSHLIALTENGKVFAAGSGIVVGIRIAPILLSCLAQGYGY